MGTPSFGSEARDSQVNNRTKFEQFGRATQLFEFGACFKREWQPQVKSDPERKVIGKFKFQEY